MIYIILERLGFIGNDVILMFLDCLFCCLKKNFYDEVIIELSDNIRIFFGIMVFMYFIG